MLLIIGLILMLLCGIGAGACLVGVGYEAYRKNDYGPCLIRATIFLIVGVCLVVAIGVWTC